MPFVVVKAPRPANFAAAQTRSDRAFEHASALVRGLHAPILEKQARALPVFFCTNDLPDAVPATSLNVLMRL